MLLPLGVFLGLLVATAVIGEQLLFTAPRAVVQLTIEIEKATETLASETLLPATSLAPPG